MADEPNTDNIDVKALQQENARLKSELEKAGAKLTTTISQYDTAIEEAKSAHQRALEEKDEQIRTLQLQIEQPPTFSLPVDTPSGMSPNLALQHFLNSLFWTVPKVKVIGSMEPVDSQDRRYYEAIDPIAFVHVEERNFRATSGYDLNWPAKAKSAADACLNHKFGTLHPQTGSQTFDALPPFNPDNRLIVMVAVVPPPPGPEPATE